MKIAPPGFCLALLLNCFVLDAQNLPDSSSANALAIYTNVVGVNKHIYNGSEYIDYDHRIKGNPFFGKNYFAKGSIVYDGILYDDMTMIYDMWRDDVVIKNYNNLPLLLVKEKIAAFYFEGHHFIRITADSLTAGLGLSGFYDVLYNGTVKLFAKRKKMIDETITTQFAESFFFQKNEYYILRNGIFYVVADKRSVLHALSDHKSELQKYIKQQKLKYRKNVEADMIKTLAYYGSINESK